MEKHIQDEPLTVLGSVEQPELLAQEVLDATSDCVLVLDCDLKVRFGNRSFYRTFQSDPRDTVGKHVYDLAIGQWLPELRMLFGDISLEARRFDSVDVAHEFPELGYRSLRLTVRRLHAQAGGEPLILLIMLDVTQQERTKDELQVCEDKYRTLVDTAQDGIWTIDHAGITTFANASMAAMLGTTADKMVGEASFEYVFDEDRERAAGLFAKKMAGDREPFEFRLRRADGSWFWASANGAPFHNATGESVGLLGTFRDITERKLAEEAAVRYADELARSSADLQHFAHVRSHDLREPLRTMREASRAALIVVHHVRKSIGRYEIGSAFRGSSALHAVGDSYLLLTRPSPQFNTVELRFQFRYAASQPPRLLELDSHSLWFSPAGQPPVAVLARRKVEPPDVAQALADLGDKARYNQLRERVMVLTECSRRTAQLAIAEACQRGSIVQNDGYYRSPR